MPRAGSKRSVRRAMINRQFDRYLRHTDRTHHAVAGIQQRLILTIFGCQRILAGGMRAARRTGERVFGLSKNGLIRSGNLPVISFRRSECFPRPADTANPQHAARPHRPSAPCATRPATAARRESGDIDCGNRQRDHKRIPCMQLPAQPALTPHPPKCQSPHQTAEDAKVRLRPYGTSYGIATCGSLRPPGMTHGVHNSVRRG